MQISSVGIDLGKTTFHLVLLGEAGKVLVRKKFNQRQLLTYTANMSTSLIGLEACSGAHYWARRFRAHGHTVRLMAPKFVAPYRMSGKRGKNDAADAAAICEAVILICAVCWSWALALSFPAWATSRTVSAAGRAACRSDAATGVP